jgi:hypothetical protein
MQQEAVILSDIPFRFDEGHFRSQVRLDSHPASLPAAQALLQETVPLLRPKAMYRVCYVDTRQADEVRLDGVSFRSRVLAQNLGAVDRVFPYVATCGTELEEHQRSCGDLLVQFWLDALKDMALGCARDTLRHHLGERFGLHPGKLSSMNPGSGNRTLWPISEQAPLFRLLGDVEQAIGVRLTDSFLMTPNKTVSGILFPTEVPFESCQLCTRPDCPRRRVPYRGAAAPAGHP